MRNPDYVHGSDRAQRTDRVQRTGRAQRTHPLARTMTLYVFHLDGYFCAQYIFIVPIDPALQRGDSHKVFQLNHYCQGDDDEFVPLDISVLPQPPSPGDLVWPFPRRHPLPGFEEPEPLEPMD